MSEQEIKAIDEASDVLRTEANSLASYLEQTMKCKLDRTDRIMTMGDVTPPRVAIAVSAEIRRLRGLADTLQSMKPEPPEEDEP